MTQAITPKLGGTGTKTEPSEGEILIGNSSSGYDLDPITDHATYVYVQATEPSSPTTNTLWVDTS